MEQKILDELVKVFNENECKTLSYSSNEEMKYIYLYAFHYYGNGDKDNAIDIENGAQYTQKFMNSAYGFYFNERTENNTLDILTTNYQADISNFDFEKANLLISSVEQMLFQYKNKVITTAINNSKLLDYWDGKDTEQPICIKFISNYKPSTQSEKEDIISQIQETIKPKLKQVTIDLVFEDDIEELIEGNSTAKECVESGFLVLDRPNNALVFGEEHSIVVNVMASSLKKNYELYAKNGLFAMNLRLYVKAQKVDSGIEESIKSTGDNFWYYNNGIIVVCDDYKVDDNKVHLKNYSIINGGQTTRMIGETKFENDFALCCKIIKNKYKDNIEKTSFVAKVAEASNTQKPIKPADVIANRIEQRLLKSQMFENNVFVQIKRGEVANKEVFTESWQKTKNEDIAQLLYAGVYQQPGTARSNKKSLFENKQKYQLIFGTKYDSSLLIDLLFIKSHYKKWSKRIDNIDTLAEDSEETKEYYRTLKGIVKNGFYYTVATIMLLMKMHYSSSFVNMLRESLGSTEVFKKTYQSITFNHRIFNCDFKSSEDKVFKLFDYVVKEYLIPSYEWYKELYPSSAYSNFTKVDSNYVSVVKRVLNEYVISGGFTYQLSTIFAALSYVETPQDKEESKELLAGSVVVCPENDNSLDTEENKELYELLKKYRTSEFIKRKIKAYQVFNDEELKRLVQNKPTTLLELEDYNCFEYKSSLKIKNYGQDIINIISTFLNKTLDK